MAISRRSLVVYGVDNALQVQAPRPIISTVAPTSSNKAFEIGTLWIRKSTNTVYCLTNVTSSGATWTQLS